VVLGKVTRECSGRELPKFKECDGTRNTQLGPIDGRLGGTGLESLSGAMLAPGQKLSIRKRWIAELIKKLWNVSWDMWAHCNGILHNSPQANEDILEKPINVTIKDFYKYGILRLPRDAMGLMHKPKEHTL